MVLENAFASTKINSMIVGLPLRSPDTTLSLKSVSCCLVTIIGCPIDTESKARERVVKGKENPKRR